ncbi:MAG: flagellar hook-basal body protein [Pyrinomonadaceae bacterium]|nr:flagellar hook-basal body protein [Phycisphaerales bacterium]
MNYGLNVAASGVLTSMYRQDVMANNLANLDTPGFKADVPFTRQRDVVRVEDHLMAMPSNQLLERLGAGLLLSPNRTSHTQGDLQLTSNPLDAAIKGTGFFVVQAPGDSAGPTGDRVRFSRDGRFTLDATGTLVQAASGLPVFDTSDREIVLDRLAGTVTIHENGTITQNNRPVAQLQLMDVPDPSMLKKVGDNLYQPSASQLAAMKPSQASVIGGSIERSAVDPIKAIMGVTSAASDVGSNARMMQLQDEIMGKAINTFGRVA